MTERVIRVVLDPATGSGAAKVQGDLTGIDKKAKGTQGAISDLKLLFQTLITVEVARKLIAYADQYQVLTNRLRTVTTSTEQLRSVQQRLFAVAQGTTTSLQSTVEIYAALSRGSERLGLSQTKVLDLTRSITQAFELDGKSSEDAAAGAEQFARALELGGVSGREFLTIFNSSPRLAKAIADGLGVTVEQLRKLAEQGRITSQALAAAVLSQKQAIASAAGEIRTTLDQATTALENSIINVIGRFDEASGASSNLAKAIIGLSIIVDENSDSFQRLGAMLHGASDAWVEYGLKATRAGLQAASAAVQSENSALRFIRAQANRIKINGIGLGEAANNAGLFLGMADNPIVPTYAQSQGRGRPTGPGVGRYPEIEGAGPSASSLLGADLDHAKALSEQLQKQFELRQRIGQISIDQLKTSIDQNFAEAEARDAIAKAADLSQRSLDAYIAGGKDALDLVTRQAQAQELAAKYALEIATNAEDFKKAYAELLPIAQKTVDQQAKLAKSIQFADDLKGAFAGAFQNINQGIKGMLRSFLQAFEQILAQRFAETLANQISGALSGSKGSGAGGGILTFLGSLLGFADGGDPPVGKPYLVGERGPEIRMDRTASRIVPLDRAGRGGSATTIQYNFYQTFAPGVSRAELAPFGRDIVQQTLAIVTKEIKRGAYTGA